MINRRKKKLVDRKVQGRLLLGIAAHWLLYFMLIMGAIPIWHVLTVSGFSQPLTAVLADSWGSMTPVFLFLAAVLPVFIWETVKFSNRFVGPMYRLHKTIQSINAGEEFRPIRFREDDFWHELADDFNTMMRRMKEQDGVCAREEAPAEERAKEEPVGVA
jgi:methyl-accepting chemotaxis protein